MELPGEKAVTRRSKALRNQFPRWRFHTALERNSSDSKSVGLHLRSDSLTWKWGPLEDYFPLRTVFFHFQVSESECNSNGLQPRSDGLQASSDGLQPRSDAARAALCFLKICYTAILSLSVSLRWKHIYREVLSKIRRRRRRRRQMVKKKVQAGLPWSPWARGVQAPTEAALWTVALIPTTVLFMNL